MPLEQSMQKTLDFFSQELMGIQAGRATKGLVEHIKIDAGYGFLPLGQLANITLPDQQTLKIEPWDKNVVSRIEKAIYDNNSGLTPQSMGDYLLIKVQSLTSERREQFKKQVSAMGEEAKARLRQARQEELKSIKREFEEKILSEDGKRGAEKKVDDTTKSFSEKIDSMIKTKHNDLMSL